MLVNIGCVEFFEGVRVLLPTLIRNRLMQERSKFGEDTALGDLEAAILDDGTLLVVIPIYSSLDDALEDTFPIAYINLNKVPKELWHFRERGEA